MREEGYYWVLVDDEMGGSSWMVGRLRNWPDGTPTWYLCDGHLPRTETTILKVAERVEREERGR